MNSNLQQKPPAEEMAALQQKPPAEEMAALQQKPPAEEMASKNLKPKEIIDETKTTWRSLSNSNKELLANIDFFSN